MYPATSSTTIQLILEETPLLVFQGKNTTQQSPWHRVILTYVYKLVINYFSCSEFLYNQLVVSEARLDYGKTLVGVLEPMLTTTLVFPLMFHATNSLNTTVSGCLPRNIRCITEYESYRPPGEKVEA